MCTMVYPATLEDRLLVSLKIKHAATISSNTLILAIFQKGKSYVCTDKHICELIKLFITFKELIAIN